MASRRSFLSAAALTAAAAALRPLPALASKPAAGLATRAIPTSGETIPVIGMGTSGSFEVETAGREPLKEVLRRFVAGGASVIDTSPNYSNAEDVLGDLMAELGLRDRIWLATKLAADHREAGELQFAQSLKRLRTDKVELLAVHNLRDWKTQLAYARELKAQGKTKYVGLTHYVDARHRFCDRGCGEQARHFGSDGLARRRQWDRDNQLHGQASGGDPRRRRDRDPQRRL